MSSAGRPSLAIDAIVLAGMGEHMELLVAERDQGTGARVPALPGSFLRSGELPLAALQRALVEEAGLDLPVHAAIPLTVRARPGRDPSGWSVALPHLVHLPGPLPLTHRGQTRYSWQPLAELARLDADHGAMVCDALGRFWPEMPTRDPRLVSIPVFGRATLGAELTFFGGSFNPWHDGHAACLQLCPRHEGLIVVPDTNPFKESVPIDCAWHRFRHLVGIAEHFGAVVFPGFCGREHANPTIGWLPFVKAARKGLLIGDDSFADFPRWTQAFDLAQQIDHLYVVARRTPSDAIERASDWFKRHASGVSIRFLGDHEHRDHSSTALREKD